MTTVGFDLIPLGLENLASHGIALGCVTNKPRELTLALLRQLGVLDHFRAVVGGDDTPEKKPHPQPLLHALAGMQVPPARALMVGDSAHDVRASHAAGMPVVAVSYGYNHGQPIADSNPDAIVDSLAELPGLLGLDHAGEA